MQENNTTQNMPQSDHQNDELQEFLASLDKDAAAARPEFEDQLYNMYNGLAGSGGGVFRGAWTMLTNKWTIAGAFAIALIAFAGLFVIRNMQVANQASKLTPQTKEVLRQVLANNPQVVLNLQNSKTNAVVSVPVITQTSSTSTSAQADYQKVKSFNYSYTRNVVDFGAAKSKCAVYNTGLEGVFETYHYYGDGENFTKSLVYNPDEELQDYYLELPEYYIHYKQGEFAAKVAIDAEAGSTSTTKTTTQTNASVDNSESEKLAVDFFGEDVEVKEQKDSDGKKYYEIIVKHDVDCGAVTQDNAAATQSTTTSVSSTQTSSSTKSSAKQNIQTIVSVAKVDAEHFEMFAEADYLGEISAKNLIRSMEIEQDTRSVAFGDVEKIFSFDYDAPIEEFSRGPVAKVTTGQILDLIAEHNIPVIWPEDGEPDMAEVVIPIMHKTENVGTEYLLQRDFYPKGDIGKTEYEAAIAAENALLNKSKLDTYLFSITYNWDDTRKVNVSTFDMGTKLQDLATEILKSGKLEEAKAETLSFTESRVNAKVFVPKQSDGQTSTQRIYVFTWGDANYVVTFDPISSFTDKQRQAALSFEVLDVQFKPNKDKLTTAISAALESWYNN